MGPVPKDAWANLVGGKGCWDPTGWMALTYGNEQMAAWRQVWLTTTEDGGAELARLLEAAAKKARSEKAAEERRKRDQAERAMRLALQERYRLDPGTVVRIKAPRTEDDGRLGRLVRMEMVGGVLWGVVLFDPCPPGHPGAGVPPRLRKIEHAIYSSRIKAECLTREHPEALG